jgi:hypothetical protein
MRRELVGYYLERPGGTEAQSPYDAPDYDPPHDAACPICGNAIVLGDIRTHSVMPISRGISGYFRTHRTCAEADADTVDRLSQECAQHCSDILIETVSR